MNAKPKQSSDQASSTSPRIAPLWRRLAAMVYDALLLGALAMVISAAYMGLQVWIMGEERVLAQQSHNYYDPLLSSILFISFFLFFTFFWQRIGQTLGMQAWSIRIENKDGRGISLMQCLLRYIVSIPSLLLCGAGFFWMLVDKDKMTWHDRYSDSRVVMKDSK